MKSKIFLSTIVHKRYLPFKHKFKYVVPGLFINLNELDKLEKTFKLFSSQIGKQSNNDCHPYHCLRRNG